MFFSGRDTNTTFILRVFPVQRLSKVHLGRRAVLLPRGGEQLVAQLDIFQHPKNREIWHSDLLGGERHVDRDPHRGAARLLQDGAFRHRGAG